MKTSKKNLLSLGFAAACTLVISTPFASAQSNDHAGRGAVEVTGKAVRAVTVGPALVHSYSGFSGGSMFVAPLITGTNADCSAGLKTSSRVLPLIADRVAVLAVGPKEIACLMTDGPRSFELLWHGFPLTDSRVLVARVGDRF
jgi:hypothetical protein